MDIELDQSDIERLLPGIKVITYPELSRYARIEDTFDRQGRVVVLFLTTGLQDGHWICLHANYRTHTIEFFDSYGLRPDGARKWLSHSKLVQLGQVEPVLHDMLKDAQMRGWCVDFSPYHFQNERDDSETCGRHVAVRLQHKDMDIEEYKAFVDSSGVTADEFVYKETYPVIHK